MLKSADNNIIGGKDGQENTISYNYYGINIEDCVYYIKPLKNNNYFHNNLINIYGAKRVRDRIFNNFFLDLLEHFPISEQPLKL